MTDTTKLQRLVQEIIRETELPRTLLAKDAEISRAAIEAWLSGNRNPTAQSAEQLAAGLEQRATRLQYLAFRLRSGLEESR